MGIAAHDIATRTTATDDELRNVIDEIRHGQAELRQSLDRVESLVLAVLQADADGSGRAVAAARFTNAIAQLTPEGAQVAVISRGEQDLLRIPGRSASHFPRTVRGEYPWYYPSDSLGAIAHLEVIRALGAEFLSIPASSRWWLDSFPSFCEHLHEAYAVAFDEPDVGTLFDLRLHPTVSTGIRGEARRFELRTGRQPSLVDWDTGLHLADRFPDLAVATPPRSENQLPYLDHTIDIVVYQGAARGHEAMRVAVAGAIDVSDPLQPAVSWHTDPSAEDEPPVRIVVLSSGGPSNASSLTIAALGGELAVTEVPTPSPPQAWLPADDGVAVVVLAGGLIVGGCAGLTPLIAAARDGAVAVGLSCTFEGVVGHPGCEVLVVALGVDRLVALAQDVRSPAALLDALHDRAAVLIERTVVAVDCREAC